MFCWGTTVASEYQDMLGKWRYEAIEAVNHDCVCSERHWYQTFDEKLRRLHPDLHLGWDRRRGRFVVYRFTHEPIRLKPALWPGAHLSYLNRFIDIVLECKQLVLEDFEGGVRPRMESRLPGEWVFHELSTSSASRFDASRPGDWGNEQIAKHADEAEAGQQKFMRDEVDAIMNDAMSIADKGNPQFVRTAVRVPEKAYATAGTP